MEKRLIPYSVHLNEDIFKKVKAAAKDRKASALIRDAITMYLEGNDEFNGGYNNALRDVIALIHKDQANNISIGGQTIGESLIAQLTQLKKG